MLGSDVLNLFESSGAVALARSIGEFCGGTAPVFRLEGGSLRAEINFQMLVGECPSASARLAACIPNNWRAAQPQVYCSESWIRKELDWHLYEDGSLCWEHPLQWKDRCEICFSVLDNGQACDRLAYDLVTNVRYLVGRHWKGAELGLVKWPSDWLQLSHHDPGTREYLKSRRKFFKAYEKELMTNKIPLPAANQS